MSVTTKNPKSKRCRNPACGASFIPSMTTQKVCSWKCGLAIAPTQRAKADKALHKVAKEKVKSKAEHAKEAQIAFNAWVRLRDSGKPCVSCGRLHEGQWHAGHYRTVGANPELRFEPLNVWRQCAPCNNHMSGNVVNYRIELVNRIGDYMVEWLEGKHEPKRYTVEELKEITAKYRALARELRKKHEFS